MKKNNRLKNKSKHGGLRSILCFVAVCIVGAIIGQVNTTAGSDDVSVKPVIPTADRYEKGRLFLERADRLVKPSANVEYQVVTGDVKFRRGDMYMFCDSAHFYDQQGSLEAFGNVRMEQGDTLFVYADMLEYVDSTELATLYADPGKKVRLINRDVELRTDIFNYDMAIELGYYEVGGELIDNANRLTSLYGEYAPSSKDAIFRTNVHLNSLSNKDTLNIYTPYLHYNTDSHVADLSEESTIVSKDGTIYTDSGSYNTESTVALLYLRSLVVTKTGKTLTGDTLFYDNKTGFGEAWGNMVLNDTVNKSKLLGDYGFYNELTDSAFVTGHALAVDYSSVDSLSLHGDTIKAYTYITKKLVPIIEPVDTLKPIDLGILGSDSIATDSIGTALPANGLTIVDSLSTELPQADSLVIERPDADSPMNIITMPDSIPADTIMPMTQAIDFILPDSLSTAIETSDTTLMVSKLEPGKLHDLSEPALSDSVTGQPIGEEWREPQVPMMEITDTTHHIVAYPNVRFFRSDLQGVCDSMIFIQKDSILYMHRDPIVWNVDRQMSGSVIAVHMNDSTADRVDIPSNAFMAEMLEEGYYNQMSGRKLTAYLADRTLRHLDVSGNVMLIFYPMEEDSTYNKVASAESSELAADFNKGQIEKLKMWPQSSEVITPLYLAKRSILFLKDFRWDGDRRPLGHDDLFPRPATSSEALIEETSELTEETEENRTEETAVPTGIITDAAAEVRSVDEPEPDCPEVD